MNAAALDLFALILIGTLAVATPLLGTWDFRRLVRKLAAGDTDARRRWYIWTIAIEWGLLILFLGWWFLMGREASPLGLAPAASGWQWLAVGLGTAGAVGLVFQMILVLGKPDQLEKLEGQLGDLRAIIPHTPREERLFVLISITAGICEEILYRGLLMAVLVAAMGTWPAVFASSVIFGAGHAYQGWAGVGKTAGVGLVMALLTVFSGSVFVAILLHTMIDATSGRMMGAAVRQAGERPTEA